ncbi:NAD-dependent epimerase/dehydratase family protein [Actinomadura fulvescens]|uniref:NAD-dependent epimerase/dehydratase family protein n=1 Tax=Actinomadura fulvescens TaxID=46160 RepID=UPI0031DD2215
MLGGTWFLGRAVVVEALRRGHDVTTFNRGKTGQDVPGAQVVRGDRSRHGDLAAAVAAGPFDVVVDPSGYVPVDVAAAAHALAARVGRYVFVSTVDAYEDWPHAPITERSPLHECPPDVAWGSLPYGHLKAGCERALAAAWPGELVVVRPGVLLGVREPKGRLPWWLRRMERGGRVLAPGEPERRLQPVDVRDAAAFVVDLAEGRADGPVNVVAPQGHTTMRRLLQACAAVVERNAELVWLPDDALVAAGVREWTELPMWRPAPGTWAVDATRARAAGLVCRPVTQTVADTWRWMKSGQQVAEHWRTAEHGIDPAKEGELLRSWLGEVRPGPGR